MCNIVDAICRHFDGNELRYGRLTDGSGVMLTMSCEHVRLTCYVRWNEEFHTLKIRSYDGLIPTEEQRMAAAEYITRANYGLSVGHFEMDFHDGEIAFVTSLAMMDGVFREDYFVPIFHANLSTHDRYFPGLASVLCNDEDPEEAIALVEGGLTDAMDHAVKRLLQEHCDTDDGDWA